MQRITEARQPAGARQGAVELVAMENQQPLAPGGPVHPLAVHLELTLQHLGEHGKACIVVARYIDESTPGALPREERPHHLRVLGGPEGAPRKARGIHDVADQHDTLGVDPVQKFVELTHPRVPKPQVDVRKKERAGTRPARARGFAARHTPLELLLCH